MSIEKEYAYKLVGIYTDIDNCVKAISDIDSKLGWTFTISNVSIPSDLVKTILVNRIAQLEIDLINLKGEFIQKVKDGMEKVVVPVDDKGNGKSK